MGTIKPGPYNPKYQGWLNHFSTDRHRFYSIPRCFEGQTVFILGGGPSLSKINFSAISERAILGINNAFSLGTWVDWCMFSDNRWWKWNFEEVEKWPNRDHMLSLCPGLLEEQEEKWPWLKIVRRDEARFGLSVEPDTVCWNRSAGGAALNVAYLMGASRAILLGFDMRTIKGKHNWHDFHKKQERDQIYRSSMMPFLKCMSDAMKVTGFEIYNATEDSALDLFPKITLKEVLRDGKP